MNDFDYENMQKKQLARNAKYRKNGSKSKKCTLPGDFLTNAEKAKLSTTVVDVNLKKKMSKEDFTKLSPEIQKEYIEWLRDEFGATSAMISKEMFGYSDAWLSIYTGKKAPHLKGLFPKERRPKPTKSERTRWLEFIGKPDLDDNKTFKPYKEDPDPEPEIQPVTDTRYNKVYKPRTEAPVEVAEEPEAVQGPTPEPKKAVLSKLSATYSGPLTAEDLALVLTDIMGDRACASISIDITF
jgi:hypothetical protein